MQLKLLFLLVLSCFSIKAAELQWAATLGSPSDDFMTATTTDLNGNVVTTGFLWGFATNSNTTITNYGSRDILVAKYNPAGTMLWAHAFGGSGEDFAERIQCDTNGNIFVAGRFSGTARFGEFTATAKGGRDIVLIKLSPDGEVTWIYTAGGPLDDLGRALAIQPDGHLLLIGAFRETCDFGGTNHTAFGRKDVFLAKINPEGNLVWATYAGGAQEDYFYDVQYYDGRIYITGLMEGRSYYGSFSLDSFGIYDAVTVCYNGDGGAVWARRIGGSQSDQANALVITAEGQIIVAGTFRSTSDFHNTNITSAGHDDVFLLSYDTNGVMQWVTTAGGPGEDTAYMIERDQFNRMHMAGRFSAGARFGHLSLTNAGGLDSFYARYTHHGQLINAIGWGGPANDAAHGVALDSDRNIIVSGNFENRMQLGERSLASINGGQDAFIAKFAAPAAPGLSITRQGSQAAIHWTPDSLGLKIEQTSNLSNTNWGLFGVLNDPQRRSIIVNTSFNRFYRLR